ncbi:hypothetical protein BDV30DRAFT_232351 [Aspergillus minisclerotigenes]|uniref:Uncharacterized protein n=1 Tax=Aspergillus minisclerotigenes TaxID=656917 RepID=A0A5N6IJL8_9EURO|nr:hypothetical protein BDV30DRAFT_232351 [Aspergillus minisclerotigenes]
MYIYQLATGILQEEPVETYNRGPPIAFASSGGLPTTDNSPNTPSAAGASISAQLVMVNFRLPRGKVRPSGDLRRTNIPYVWLDSSSFARFYSLR